ncbi:formimidoylglutamate deiminase [Candidatus Uabimicrobium amorphum]|uniref:Formimidoylglutamate deiminase n=1 Tax=Uabimicrobium amorphum TaxID=2596890 RepID=A0A5S9F2E8_UABAM|nr:formimidoylglutamate deiminase [Candidatus Uabimicrobium amorphum]BBM83043.1 formimidoylglutamate deiminase [Candidatus Uabimicrobium amorphum]
MKTWKFDALLQNDRWLQPAYITVDNSGVIQEIAENSENSYEEVKGVALPGYQNAHSHAFQYAMAGTAEHLPVGAQSDDFWSWREAMYRLALNVSPQDIRAIATMLYSEMLRHGYTAVTEFHYVHHNTDGTAYDNLAEMGTQLIAAAKEVGIDITLVPIFYQMGDFGVAAKDGQRRFISSTVDDYLKLYEKSREACTNYDGASIGVGVHSLRAVHAEDIIALFAQTATNIPRHIHIAEQQKEVDSCIAYTKQRPVEWLLNNVNLDETYHLVHATHLDANEVSRLCETKAHVVLCPSTEGNLGDGLFSLRDFWQQGGHWSIGTDSHVGLNPMEELRILDYGQRLHFEKRNILCRKDGEDSGEQAFMESVLSGRKAMGNLQQEFFAVGQPLNAVVMDHSHPLLATTSLQRFLATVVYSCDVSAIRGTMVNGSWVIQNQRHAKHEQIVSDFCDTITKLKNR